MNQHINDALANIVNNCKIQISDSNAILHTSEDYYARHQANSIKSKAEDNLRMVAAIEELINRL